MYLKKLSVIHFKNIGSLEAEFSPNLNCFVGDNGSGKTNVLDALHYLSLCKSFQALTDGQAVMHGKPFFVVDGSYVMDGGKTENVVCSFRRAGGKVVKRNGKEYKKLSEHIGLLPLVMVSPSDTALIHDSPDERRRYLNTFLSQLDREYLSDLVAYNLLLSQRNRLLKGMEGSGSYEVLEAIDHQMAAYGERIFGKRRRLVEEVAPRVAEYYRVLSDDRERVEMAYRSDLLDGDFAALLRESAERDLANRHTTVGVHRDDIRMDILGHPIRKYGSQGQQKSFLIALKLAQFDIMEREKGIKPVLLLDDVFDKLDMKRVENLIRLVAEDRFGQIFVTDSNKVRLDGILSGLSRDYSLFGVSAGEVKLLTEDGE